MAENRNPHGALVEKTDGKRPLGRPKRRWEENIKTDLQKWGGVCGLDRSGSGYGELAGACECGNEPSGSIKWGNFLAS